MPSAGEESVLAVKGLMDFLKSVPLFQKLSSDSLEALVGKCVLQRFEVGETVLEENVEGGALYLVFSGAVEVSKLGDKGQYVLFNRLNSTDYFGEMSIMTGEATAARITAATPCEIVIISREDFDEILSRYPEIYQHLAITLSSRLRNTDRAILEQRHKEIVLKQILEGTKREQYASLLGKSPTFRKAIAQTKDIFKQSQILFIYGETGVGKEAAAFVIHRESERSGMPFISVDCSQFKEDEWGVRLFGTDVHSLGQGGMRRFGYLELAEGGTVLLKNVDLLSHQLQAMLKDFILQKSSLPAGEGDIRYILTSRGDLKPKVENGDFDRELYSLVESRSVRIPSLRERKRDIPALVDHFVEKHAARMKKPVREVDNEVLKKLLSHDYTLGNIQELEEIIQRSIVLTDGDTIRTEHLFLGQPAAESEKVFNFFQSSILRAFVRKGIWPLAFQIAAAAIFIGVFYFLYTDSRAGGGNRGLILVWGLWWPALVLSFFWLSRAWCALCPISSASKLIQKVFHRSLPVPSVLKKYDFLIVTVGFLFIVWVEEVTRMRSSPVATSYLLEAILLGAIVSGILFQRQCWCRHLCPLGGMAGLFAQTSILELRTNTALCANKCTTHDCFTGRDSHEGCPMFQHLMFQDTNQFCKFCFQCAVHCPNDVVQLNLRVPGQDIWTSDYSANNTNILVASFLGALIPVLLFQKNGFSWAFSYNLLVFTILFSGAALGAIFLLRGLARASVEGDEKLQRGAQRNLHFTYVPLLLGAFLAFHFQFVPGFSGTVIRADFVSLLLKSEGPAGWSALHIFQGLFLIVGLLLSVYALVRVTGRIKRAGGRLHLKYWAANIAVMVIYAGGVLTLLKG